jgi:hypothetical protein
LQISLETYRNQYAGANAGYGDWTRYGPAGEVQIASDASFLLSGPTVVGTGLYQFPFAGGSLKLNGAGRYYQIRNFEREELTSAPAFYSWERKTLTTQAELGAHYERGRGRTVFETQLLYRATRRAQRNDDTRPPRPSLIHAYGILQESAARSTLRFKKDARFNLEGFAELAYNSQTNRSDQTAGGVAQVVPGAHVKVSEWRGETGVTASWKPSPSLGFDATAKWESSDIAATGDAVLEHRLSYLKPRLVAALSLDKNTQVRLRAEREVDQIAFANFMTLADYSSSPLRVGNVGIRPQRDWVGEAVFERRFWNGADLTLTARRLALQDVVDVAPLLAGGQLFGQVGNIGDGRETDLGAILTVPLKRFGVRDAVVKAVVTRVRQRVTDPVTGRDRRLTGQPKLFAELHYAQDFPHQKLNWGVDAYYRGATVTFRPFGDQTVGAYPHANVFVEYRPEKNLVLRAEVQNLPAARVKNALYQYSGLKERSPLVFTDRWRLSGGPIFYLRARRTFT